MSMMGCLFVCFALVEQYSLGEKGKERVEGRRMLGQLTEEQIYPTILGPFIPSKKNQYPCMSLKLTCGFISINVSDSKFSKEPIRRSKGSLNILCGKTMWQGQIQLDIVILCALTHTHVLMLSFTCFFYRQTTGKKNIKKEEAEELKLKLEAVGGTVEIV